LSKATFNVTIMKPVTYLLLVFTLFVLITSSCKKYNGSSLPPATQTGANTFGCLINGKVFTPGGGDGLSGGNLGAIFEYAYITPGIRNPTGFVFAVSGVDERNSCNVTSIGFGFDSVIIPEQNSYILQTRKAGSGGGQYVYGTCSGVSEEFMTSDLVTGQLYITRFDETNQIASGTFWFNVLGNNGDTIKITDGRFDVHFTE